MCRSRATVISRRTNWASAPSNGLTLNSWPIRPPPSSNSPRRKQRFGVPALAGGVNFANQPSKHFEKRLHQDISPSEDGTTNRQLAPKSKIKQAQARLRKPAQGKTPYPPATP